MIYVLVLEEDRKPFCCCCNSGVSPCGFGLFVDSLGRMDTLCNQFKLVRSLSGSSSIISGGLVVTEPILQTCPSVWNHLSPKNHYHIRLKRALPEKKYKSLAKRARAGLEFLIVNNTFGNTYWYTSMTRPYKIGLSWVSCGILNLAGTWNRPNHPLKWKIKPLQLSQQVDMNNVLFVIS